MYREDLTSEKSVILFQDNEKYNEPALKIPEDSVIEDSDILSEVGSYVMNSDDEELSTNEECSTSHLSENRSNEPSDNIDSNNTDPNNANPQS
jgi:hypothetical protein